MQLLATADLSARPVSRPRVLALLRNDAHRAVSMVAPGGYGKTTMLRSWPQHSRPFHYVQPTAVRHDGAELLFRVRRALDAGGPYVLAVDGIGAPSPQLLMSLYLHIHSAPEGSRLLLSSRRPVDWASLLDVTPEAIRQIGPADLAFTSHEAMDVLAASGVHVDDVDADRLFDRTRGWPIAQHLSALLLRGAPDPGAVVDEIIGGDGELTRRLVRQLLARTSAGTRKFLMWTSVLMTMSGPLCDWLLEAADSDVRLEELARHDMLVTRVYGKAGSYRYQRLFGELLRAELNDDQPDLAASLHLRASEWFARRGDDVAARWHRQAARARTGPGGATSYLLEARRVGSPHLSPAELQVLALLPSHLSFHDIGMRLGRSGQGIQRLAIGIYRKLGVISRRDAVERALVLGLVARDALTLGI